MTTIYITCPTKQVPTSTGMGAPPGADLEKMFTKCGCSCTACGGRHVWNGKDGYWRDQPMKPAPQSFPSSGDGK